MILLEDIDAAFAQRQKADGVGNKLTFSGLLNALDGAGSKEGTMVFMTTNHKERLDEALIRPGRADIHLEFCAATPEQANRMFLAFFPDVDGANGFGEAVAARQWSMAEIQRHLIDHQHSAMEALTALTSAVPEINEEVA